MNKAEQLKQILSGYTATRMCEYLNVTNNQFSYWIKHWIPRKYERLIIEYFEIQNDDLIEFLQKLW